MNPLDNRYATARRAECEEREGATWGENMLRHVRLETGHTLHTWSTGRTRGGRTCIGYELCDVAGKALFRGEDFRPSPMHADDADATLRGLLGFLTLRPGDTDREYFADYTARQRAFAESSECELLAFLYSDDGEGTFTDPDDESEGGAS
jgi:hypothetical protein